MTCASCVGRVERAVAAVPGVAWVSVNLATERAMVELYSSSSTVAAVEEAVHRAGYAASRTDDDGASRDAQTEARRSETTSLPAISLSRPC